MIVLLLLLAVTLPSARLELDHNRDYILDKYSMSDRPPKSVLCKKPAKCFSMSNVTCLGTKLPYETTSLDLIPGYATEATVRERLHVLQGIKYIPKCWAVVQPLLCSLFMPKCVNGAVNLPPQEICKKISGPCRILFNQTIWPKFINCEDTSLFPEKCKKNEEDTERKLRSRNLAGRCLDPLVPTDYELATFEGVEGCGIPCNDTLYTEDEKSQIQSFILWAAGICCSFNAFTVLTFTIDWSSTNKYPAQAIFYMNLCFMISCFGWLIQFLSRNKEEFVCRKDGTLRMNEPSGDSLMCMQTFILVYYFTVATMVWFVIFAYTYYLKCQALGKIENKIDRKKAYFHLVAWCFPLVMTVSAIASGEIEGNHETGICFLGDNSHFVRASFVLAPTLVAISIGGYYLFKGWIILVCIYNSSQEIISEKASSKILDAIIRLGLFSLSAFLAVVITFYCHYYNFKHSAEWKQSFRDFILCSITSKYAEVSECQMRSRPSAGKLQLHLLANFMVGVLIASWILASSTIATWSKFLKSLRNSGDEQPVKLRKHEVIAQAFAQRHKLADDSRLSISLRNARRDPLGLDFELDSVAPENFSTTWANALPKFLARRGALVGESTSRRNSTDSQFSINLRQVSVGSRRNSGDSQFFVSFNEMKADFKACKRTSKGDARAGKKKRSKGFGKCRQDRVVPGSRRGSVTSFDDSQLGMQILSALAMGGGPNGLPLPPGIDVPAFNMGRRDALLGPNSDAPNILALRDMISSESDVSSE